MATTTAAGPPAHPPLRVNLESAGGSMLALTAMCGGFVLVEPSPFEVAFLFTLALFLAIGIRLRVGLLPLMVTIVLWLLGGFFSLIPVVTKTKALMFFLISAYLGIVAISFAAIFSDRTVERLDSVRNGYIAGALIAALTGIIGFFEIAGTGELFSFNNRARGTFKDPNVLGPFLVLPTLWLIQPVILGTARRPLLSLLAAGILVFAVFLSFSRGAWGAFVVSMAMMLGLTFLTEPTGRARFRIAAGALVAVGLFALLIGGALSIDEVRKLFEIRASLNQDYDLGEFGRFGSQLRSLPMLLDRPNGFGPMQYREFFPEDPHNVYIAAFAYYGWLGGIAYIALVALTCVFGWRLVWRRTPWQHHAVVIWSTLFVQMVQGLQIDTDHWRHFFLMLGAIWGMVIATELHQRKRVRPLT